MKDTDDDVIIFHKRRLEFAFWIFVCACKDARTQEEYLTSFRISIVLANVLSSL
jgi:hypothetical protein